MDLDPQHLGPLHRPYVRELRALEQGLEKYREYLTRSDGDWQWRNAAQQIESALLPYQTAAAYADALGFAPGDALARLVGVDTYWVETTLPLDRLRWLSFSESAGRGSPVTLRQRKGQLKGLKVAIVGDITHSRLARSNIWGLNHLGAGQLKGGNQVAKRQYR